ncbi:unnamed protein product [Caenorhabditis bovis]|uniref:Ubiquitin carboxyl-terminal hydrolase n=1 Tax=Caenorhabditis bovis TaxID=2654633 RepID=A0A8S1EQK9_9PELO|nr:unnamed protein product [Caenorhabditis bovis]
MPTPEESRMEDGEIDGVIDEKVPPTKEDLKKLIKAVENAPLEENDTWFVISQDWWDKFIQAVDNGFIEDIPEINNTLISNKNQKNEYFLKSLLAEGVDYQTIPEFAFKRLRNIFGLDNDARDYIPRTVVRKNGSLCVEVYPRIVHIALFRNKNIKSDLILKADDTMQSLRDRAINELNLKSDEKLRFYVMNGKNAEPELVDTSQSIDSYFDTVQNVLIDTEEDGQFFYQTKPANQTKSLFGTNSTSSSIGNGTYGLNYSTSISSGHVAKVTPGQCGLHNLGNTCFMASALQCLSNMPPLRDYFLSDAYIDDLNETNPLGTHGHLAQAVGEMFKNMWSGQYSSYLPRKFKSIIGEFAPRFNGYSQQDAHELMAYVLDGLHEDLNRIKKKPYIEDNDEHAKLPIHEYAEKSWEVYKMRNDSIIVDTLHGQLKSTLVCPVCAKISIKFDPFGYLSLPLPEKDSIQRQTILLMHTEKKWSKFAFRITQKTTIAEVEEMMWEKLKPSQRTPLVFFYQPSSVQSNDDIVLLLPTDSALKTMREIYAAEVEHDPMLPSTKILVVYNRVKISRACSLPMVFTLKDESVFTKSFLTGKVLDLTKQFFFVKRNVDSESGDETVNGIDENTAYKIFLQGPESSQTPITSIGNDPIGWIEGKDPYTSYKQVVFQWKDSKLFNQYKGGDLVERESTVPTREKVHLMETLNWFTKKEQLGEQDLWYCPECKKHERATKQLDLWKLPEILVLHLKRFQYNRYARDKLTWEVVIPVRGLDLTPKIANEKHQKAVYDLIGISKHYGSLSGGHYTATALNDHINRWIDFNDDRASPTDGPTDPYEASDPYMLVYRRRPLDKNGEPLDPAEHGYPVTEYRTLNVNQRVPHASDENLEMEMDED